MTQPSDEAIEAVYAAFKHYPAPRELHGAEHRDAEAILASILSKPLHALGLDDLQDFAAHTPYTLGTVAIYKHFLPRILAIALRERPRDFGFEPWGVASRLVWAGFADWPDDERYAIGQIFAAGLREAVASDADGNDVDEWLNAAMRLNIAIGPILDDWLALASGPSVLNLVDLIQGAQTAIPAGEGMWADIDVPSRRALVDWLTSEAVEQVILSGVDMIDAADQWKFDSVDTFLFNLREAGWR